MTDSVTDYEKWFDDAIDDASARLTEAGRVRRAVMRQSLQAAVVTRRRRRTVVRSASAVLAVVLLVFGWWQATPAIQLPAPGRSGSDLASLQHVEYQVVNNDSSLLDRYRAEERPPSAVVEVGDDELLELLAAAGRPTGFIRAQGRLIVTRDVTDPIGE